MSSDTPSFRRFPARAILRPLAYSLAAHVFAFAIVEIVASGDGGPNRILAELETGDDRFARLGGGGDVAGGGGGETEGELSAQGEALRRVLAGEGAPEPASEESSSDRPDDESAASAANSESAVGAEGGEGVPVSAGNRTDGSTSTAGDPGEAVNAARRAVTGADSEGRRSARGASGTGEGTTGEGRGKGRGSGRGAGRGADGPTLAAIEAVIREHYDQIDRCYAGYRSYTAEGRRVVHVQFRLGEQPRPLAVNLVKFTTDEKVARCIVDAMDAWVFPDLSEPATFDKTFVFHQERSQRGRPGLGDFFGGPPVVD